MSKTETILLCLWVPCLVLCGTALRDDDDDQQDCSYLVTDFSMDTCIARFNGNISYFMTLDSDCIPDCVEYKYAKDDQEDSNKGDPCDSSTPCPPGYDCEVGCSMDPTKKCVVDEDCGVGRNYCQQLCLPNQDSCMRYHIRNVDFPEGYGLAKWKPSCENNGDWKAKQCKGGVTGRCFCFDKKGKRIFGQALFKDSEDMECGCSRRRADLEESGRSFVSFHCDKKGNYEPLQCDSGMCWCVNKKTGELTSTVVPEKAMSKLPCYLVANVGSQYLRLCDSIKSAIGKLTEILRLHGVTNTYTNPLVCDGDGGYGAYNVSNGIAQCIWRDGKRLGGWQTQSDTDLRTVTCNCARDLKLYSHSLTCSGSGDYNPVQYVTQEQQPQYYCVDSDGFMKSEIMPTRPANCSLYY